MTRALVLTIIGCVLLSLALVTICHWIFPDILPYAAGSEDASSWRRQVAFLMTASAWLSAEAAGLFAIVLAALLWNRSTERALQRVTVARKLKKSI